jgi:phage terminase Nu1 subunit (DNA packaging protein)
MPLVEVKQLMQALNVTERWIGQLVKEGMPREGRGKYDLGKCMLWYIRYLQAAVKRRNGSEIPDDQGRTEQRERLRLLSAEAELKELELARERGEFIALPDLEKMMTDLVITTKARILAVSPRISAQLVGVDRLTIEAELDKELRSALSCLAKSVNGNGHHSSDPDTAKRSSKVNANRNLFPE